MLEAANWLITRGEKLWDPDEISAAQIAPRAAAGELVIGFESDIAAACMFLQHEDKPYWPEDPPGDAYYVHRLAVRRQFAGAGWAKRLLEWAIEEARRDGRNFIRLDTEQRPRLLRHYESLGFNRVDPEPLQIGRHLVIRLERPV